ncbi:uncharacterized protein Z519_02768 [Cladophialophora bantiana CBS 173.52]|uniref:Chromosome condensation protein n=1 Tax=Cladophialophora bantiana (strain ATCC 10958 / CBS 173.52 / CDC B-1940 / NIH 8579) TaxID=1442370 RepID=A0A0D2F554_CLAB1|nr:uncharacterized protein Z519_02768 [Cladophialophora bantiana CBS 173.52]KIW97376.1 hypothetical protein Z519_02768 [Cladophialophora bantiana CBS 173.52]
MSVSSKGFEARNDLEKGGLSSAMDEEEIAISGYSPRGEEEPDNYDENAGLSEMAMPQPARPENPEQDNLEREELTARRLSTRGGRGSGDEYLTELRVPSIVGHGDESEARPPWGPVESPPSSSEEKEDASRTKSHPALVPMTEFYVIGYLIFFAIFGTLSRLGVEAINTYPDAPVLSPVLWANVGGSLIFGFLAEDRQLFKEEWGPHHPDPPWSLKPPEAGGRQSGSGSSIANEVASSKHKHLKVKKTIPLYIGLSTGFCGSFTSFSTFLRDAFLALSGQLGSLTRSQAPSPRHRGYDFEAVVAVLIVHVACSLAALKFGAHLALATQSMMPTLPFRRARKVLDPAIVILGLGCWIGAILLAIWPPKDAWRGQVIFSLIFAPVGCLFRFYLSKHLNRRIPSFPVGTFLANISGTAALGVCFIVQRFGHRSVLSCQVLNGIMDGFSGCATTVSTWVGELETLRRKHAHIYGASSVAVGLSILVVIIGSLLWSAGFDVPACHI